MKQFYDCHMQGNGDIRNLFFQIPVYIYSVLNVEVDLKKAEQKLLELFFN